MRARAAETARGNRQGLRGAGAWGVALGLAASLVAPAVVAQQPVSAEAISQMVQEGRLGPAVEALGRELGERDDPALRDLALRLATLAEQAGERSLALGLAETVAAQTSSPRALLLLARLEARSGDGTAALGRLRRAVELAPNSEEVLAALGRLQLGAGDPAASLTPLEALVRMFPERAEYPYLLGVAWMQLGDAVEAVEALERARTLEPERARILIALGLVFDLQKRYDEAGEVLRLALRLDPDNPEALAALAEAEEGLGDLDTAETRARRVLGLRPDHPGAHRVLGNVFAKRGQFAEARVALEQAAAVDPSDRVYYQLSQVCARLGDREASNRYRGLYQQALDDKENRLRALRGQDGDSELQGGQR